jgi:hypothetical protein
MQVIENWSDLTGQVVRLQDDAERPGYKLLDLAVKIADPVPGVAHLLADKQGSNLSLHVPASAATNLATGDNITVRARLAGPNLFFSHPENLSVLSK